MFFLSREKPPTREPLARLVALAGVQNPRMDSRVEGLLTGTWAGLACECSVAEREDYRLLWISFGQGLFRDRISPRPDDELLESEPGLQLVHAFRDTCDALAADTGMLLTHNWQATDEWLAEQEWAVAGLFSLHLRSLGIGLLYLNSERVQAQSSQPRLDAHDQLPAQRGRLYFSGRGRDRWL
ncbi:uncharacterized protein STAUR_6850 [Stigmatella aurantiaca DW4/3-1]|uniref:Uncharacterized protein n=1 Tax=Stigmatella aurantiaca (strain DW4/3-1) TaxID=378806 RepID=E3FSY3_STIAD|nr:uncharacterized protein STAUR_6850 [Stigmatella aurantiaca DW4/3-1]